MATTEEISKAPPCISERYEVATSTSTLKMVMREEAPTSPADIIAAAGMMQVTHDGAAPVVWSATRTGMALLRLASEWDSAAKPRRPAEHLIEALAATIKAEDAQAVNESMRFGPQQPKPRGPVLVRAYDRAQAWYVAELRLLAVSLKSRAVVWEQLEHWRALKGIDPQTVAEALLHWLDHTCPHCDGHGLRKVEGAPAHSARPCRECNGGEKHRPPGTTAVLNFLDNAVNMARTSLKRRLHQRG